MKDREPVGTPRLSGRACTSWTLPGGLALLVLLGGLPAEATSRGAPNTATRANWCSERLVACEGEMEDDCAKRYADDIKGELQCNSDGWNSCKRQYGGTSDCRTREKPEPGANIRIPGKTGKGSFTEGPRPTTPRAQPRRIER